MFENSKISTVCILSNKMMHTPIKIVYKGSLFLNLIELKNFSPNGVKDNKPFSQKPIFLPFSMRISRKKETKTIHLFFEYGGHS